MKRKNNITGFLFASPWIIGFLLFTLYPILISLYYSATDFSLFKPAVWVGLENYKNLFKDALFVKSLYNTLYMTILGTPIFLFCGLMTALMLNLKVKGQSIYRTIFFVPAIIPVLATSLVWLWVLNAQSGLLNVVLKIVGISGPNWLTNSAYTKLSLIIIGAWGSGQIMIIFLASLQDVPKSLYEAAEIDGASVWKKFLNITLPGISPIIFFQLIMGVIANLQYFTQAYIIASVTSGGGLNSATGGPENSLLFYALYLYQNGFVYFKMGTASAMAWILFVIVAAITWLVFKSSAKWVTYGGE